MLAQTKRDRDVIENGEKSNFSNENNATNISRNIEYGIRNHN